MFIAPWLRLGSRLIQAAANTETGQKVSRAVEAGATELSREAQVVGAHVSSAAEKAALKRRAKRVIAQLREQADAGAMTEVEFLRRAEAVLEKTGLDLGGANASLAHRLRQLERA